jgi:hypothetical protein
MIRIATLAKILEKKYAQVLDLGTSESKPQITVAEAEIQAQNWFKTIPQTSSEYTTAKDLLGYLTGNRTSKGIMKPITAHSRYWALEDVKKYHTGIDPDLFKEVIDVLWNYIKPQL